jgi:hypothetical protein
MFEEQAKQETSVKTGGKQSRLHSVISQKTVFLTATAMRTSDPTKSYVFLPSAVGRYEVSVIGSFRFIAVTGWNSLFSGSRTPVIFPAGNTA